MASRAAVSFLRCAQNWLLKDSMPKRFLHFFLDMSRHMCINSLVKTFTTVQAAQKLGVARDTVYRWMRANRVKGAQITKIGDLRVRLWTEDDLNRIRLWMKENPHPNRGRKRKRKKD